MSIAISGQSLSFSRLHSVQKTHTYTGCMYTCIYIVYRQCTCTSHNIIYTLHNVMCIYIVCPYTCVIVCWLGSSRRSGCGLEWAWPSVVLALLPHVYTSIDVTSEREGGRGLRESVFEGEGRSVCVCLRERACLRERGECVCQGRGHSKQYLQLPHTHTHR